MAYSQDTCMPDSIHTQCACADLLFQLGVVNQFPDTHDQTLYDDATLFFQQSQEPLITAYTGAGAKGYSSENDVLDPDFINTYYGDYARLSKVKAKYDPKDVFIVPTGVGAERWSFDGNCKA